MSTATRRRAPFVAGIARRLERAWLGRGPLATALLPLAWLFGAVVAVRRFAFSRGWRDVRHLPVPVVVVGNLVAGGAGKTPTVIAVVALLRDHGFTPGVVSRGYRRSADSVLGVEPDTPVADAGDEPLLLSRATGVPVFVGRDRVAAGETLLRRHPAVDVIVSDDGLQHLRLARTAQVLVFDERGAGNGWLLPAGPLREPLPRARPARTVVLYNTPRPSTPLAGTSVQRSLRAPVELSAWRTGQSGTGPATGTAIPDPATTTKATATTGFAALRGRRIVAAAGLARPERFFAMLRDEGLSFTPMPLPDHFDFAALPWPADSTDVVLTEKDAVKLGPERLGSTRVWVVALDFEPGPVFEAELLALLPAPQPAA